MRTATICKGVDRKFARGGKNQIFGGSNGQNKNISSTWIVKNSCRNPLLPTLIAIYIQSKWLKKRLQENPESSCAKQVLATLYANFRHFQTSIFKKHICRMEELRSTHSPLEFHMVCVLDMHNKACPERHRANFSRLLAVNIWWVWTKILHECSIAHNCMSVVILQTYKIFGLKEKFRVRI